MKRITLKIALFAFVLISVTMFGQVKLEYAIEENHDGTNWNNVSRTDYQYDANNNLKYEVFSVWDGSSAWVTSNRDVNTYNANNRVTETINQDWSVTENKYNDSDKTENKYDATSGDITEQIEYDWDGSKWVEDGKLVILYSNDGKISGAEDYEWIGGAWVLTERSTLTYNGSGAVMEILDEERDNASAPWEETTRLTFAYDGSGKLTGRTEEEKDGANWTIFETVTYSCDGNSNRDREDIDNMYSRERIDYMFDNSQQLSSFIHPFNDKTGLDYFPVSFIFVDKLLSTEEATFNSTGGTWDSNLRTTYYYSDNTASVDEFNVGKLKVYPNPTKSIINIDLENLIADQVKLYNVLGKQVLKTDLKQIDMAPLANGVYILEVKTVAGHVLRKRVIKN